MISNHSIWTTADFLCPQHGAIASTGVKPFAKCPVIVKGRCPVCGKPIQVDQNLGRRKYYLQCKDLCGWTTSPDATDSTMPELINPDLVQLLKQAVELN